MAYYLNSERVRDIQARYAVALNAVAAAEYREVFELPGPEDWGGDLTHAEWLDGFSTVDHAEPLGPEPRENWVFGPEAHPPVWPHYIDREIK